MATLYGTVLGNPQTINQYNNIDPTSVGSPASGLQYPSSNFITTFGPVYLPRVYASNLSALEIGSSGTIEYTLYDVSSLEMSRNVASSNVIIQTPNLQDSLWIGANNSNMYLSMNSKENSNITTLFGSNALRLVTSNDMKLIASNIGFVGAVSLDGTTIQSTASSGGSSTSESINGQAFTVSAANSNSFFQMNNNTQLFTTGNLAIGASNNVIAIAEKNMYLTTSEGSFKIAANSSNMLFQMSYPSNTMALYSTCNIDARGVNDVKMFASASNQYLTFIHDNVTTTLSNAETNGVMNIGVSGDMNIYTLTSLTNSNFGTHSVWNAGDFYEQTVSKKIVHVVDTYTESNFSARTNYVQGPLLESNVSTKTVNVLGVYTESNLDARIVYVQGPQLEVSASTKTVNVVGIYTESNLDARSVYVQGPLLESNVSSKTVNVLGVYTESNFDARIVSVQGPQLEESASTKTVNVVGVYTESNLDAKNVYVQGPLLESNVSTKTVNVLGDYTESNLSARNVYVNGKYTEFVNANKEQHSEGTTLIKSKQNMTLQSILANVYISTPTIANISAGTNTIEMDPYNTTHNAPTSHNFQINNNSIMQIVQSNVIINGNLQISGVIDSTNVTQTNLLVENKEIYLAYNSNVVSTDSASWITDGVANDQSGIVIQGCPANITQYSPSNNEMVYEKSVKWNNNSGMFTGNSNESFWEVKGGSLKITDMNPQSVIDGNVTASNPISFHFRINNQAELEIIKYYTVNHKSISQVVAKFGRTPGFSTLTPAF